MSVESESLESYYASNTLLGLIRSGFVLLIARRVRPRSRSVLHRLRLANIPDYIIYAVLIIIPAIILDNFQRLRTLITGRPRRHPSGSWQFYLQTGLREDSAHHTNETMGYHKQRPEGASEVDDLTAWTMAVSHFLWNYDELIGVVWDEWTLLRLVEQAAQKAGLGDDPLFHRLQRQWEVARPYCAPLNGTYADVRRDAFASFIRPRLDALPERLRADVLAEHRQLGETERAQYQQQMSLLATLNPRQFIDEREPIGLWETCVGLIVGGEYYLIQIADHDAVGRPVMYDASGQPVALRLEGSRVALPDGEPVVINGDTVTRAADGAVLGYLDMTPAARVKWQIRAILEGRVEGRGNDVPPTDRLLAEAPRRAQRRLRQQLPHATRVSLQELARAPIIINWDEQPGSATLAELRRTQRGVGDHALTIIRTERSFVFDHSHIFFDGTWSLAVAEVLTNAAVRWCERCMTLTPLESRPAPRLSFEPTEAFLHAARRLQSLPEVAAETTIWDNTTIFELRKMLSETGTHLTVNDLLVITRIFHAAHYRPSPAVQQEIDALRAGARTAAERRAVRAIDRSLERGRLMNPALLIPVDASPTDPRERIFPITFRNLADNLVRVWDDTWDAYQAYRRIEPPDTPEGQQAFNEFALNRRLLIGNLRAFSHVLEANKAVAIRGESLNIAVLKLLVGLPLPVQALLKEIPERVLPLNEIIRGDEVYSNVGRVARGSSLSRFMTAKDDGNTKALAWGVMSDDDGRLIVTMRDFRPHVAPLLEAGRADLAHALAHDYVSSYTADLIGLVARLSAMLQAEAPRTTQRHGTIAIKVGERQ